MIHAKPALIFPLANDTIAVNPINTNPIIVDFFMTIYFKLWVAVNSATYLFQVVFIPHQEVKLNPLLSGQDSNLYLRLTRHPLSKLATLCS